MAATLDDVAKRAGCSTATVSRVVNGVEGVSDEVRATVEAAIEELGYVSRRSRAGGGAGRPQARLFEVLLHRSSDLEPVAVAADGAVAVGRPAPPAPLRLLGDQWQLSNTFYRHILDGIVLEFARHEAKAMLQVVDDLAAPDSAERIAVEAEGVLVVGEGGAGIDAFIETCRRPLVLVDILDPQGRCEQVTTDNLGGIGQAVDHLAGLGHRRLGFVSGTPGPVTSERAQAFAFHAHRRGLQVLPGWEAVAYDHIDGTTQRVAQALRTGDHPSGIVCCNDWGAIAVQRAAASLGLRIPDQLSVIGFDDVVMARLVTPALSSVRVDAVAIGRMGARLLLGQRDGAVAGCVTRVPTVLVPRDSTAAPR